MTKYQTSVSYTPVRGLVGDIANLKPKFAVSMVAEETLPAGIFVKLGTDLDKQVANIAETGDVALGKTVGVTLHDESRPMTPLSPDNTGGEGVRDFAANESVAVLKEGSVYMLPETAVTPATALYIRHAGRSQVQTLVFAGDLIAANVTNGSFGGVAISPVTYGTDNATTLTAIAAAITTANPLIYTATSDGTHTITVTTVADADDQDASDWVVTLGSTATTITATETATSVHTENIGRIRNDSDTSTATAVPAGTVRALESVAADTIVPVSINLN